ncbi:MAG TPA: general secretion pathway protein GspB [Methylomirabilota bacterium]|nr:general secretion pathway protein GspB [Methylomirabilota bacterium]
MIASPQPAERASQSPDAIGTSSALRELASKLKVEALVWAANPRERMVFMNGRKYVEGQALDDGVVVEEIAENGVVLVQGGQRVRVRAETR